MKKRVRETSLEAYNEIKENGLLSKRRFQVYKILFDYGPLTANEVCDSLEVKQSSITPRFAELLKAGVIQEVGKRACSITGKTCIEWDVTKNLPKKVDKPIVKKCTACNGSGVIFELRDSLADHSADYDNYLAKQGMLF